MILPTLSARWSALRGIARARARAHRHQGDGDRRRAAAARQCRDPVQSHELHGRGHHRVGAAGRAGLRRQEGIRRPGLRRHLHAPARRLVRRALRCGREPRGRRDRDRPREGRAGCSCSSRKARSRAAPACSASTWARSRSRRKPASRSCRACCAACARCCAATNGSRAAPPISVVIEEPIQPAGTDFTAMLAMRDAARAAMLKHVGEPDLGALEKPPAPVA